MFVRCVAILSAIIVTSSFNYIPILQLCIARVTKPFLFMRRGSHTRLIKHQDDYADNCCNTL